MKKLFSSIAIVSVLALGVHQLRSASTTLDGMLVSIGTGTMLLADNVLSGVAKLSLGGVSASFPALVRSGAAVQVKLADDSAYAAIKSAVLQIDGTNTPIGSTGTRVLNKGAGKIVAAIGATSLVVTNSLVTTNSIILVTMQSSDASAVVSSALPGTGQFTITMSTNTAAAAIGWLVINP